MNVSTLTSQRVAQDLQPQKGYIRAWIDAFPLSLNVFSYGVTFGAMAHGTTHLSFIQTMAMSGVIFAGVAQFSILSLIHSGAQIWTIVLSTFLLNMRQVLYGITLGRAFRNVPKRHLVWMSYVLTDESYSLSSIEAERNGVRRRYFLGVGSSIYIPWVFGSAIGFTIGSMIGNPARYGLDFAFIGAFLGLLIIQLKNKKQIITALIAAVVAIGANDWFGTSGGILAGAVAAFVMGVYFNGS